MRGSSTLISRSDKPGREMKDIDDIEMYTFWVWYLLLFLLSQCTLTNSYVCSEEKIFTFPDHGFQLQRVSQNASEFQIMIECREFDKSQIYEMCEQDRFASREWKSIDAPATEILYC